MAPDEIKPEEQPGAGPGSDPAATGKQADVGPGRDPDATGEQTERPEGATERQTPWAWISKKVSDWFDRQP